MRVLSISLEKNILTDGTEARKRQIKYGNLCEQLHILVLYPGQDKQISKNVWIYGAVQGTKIARFLRTFKKAGQIIEKNKIDFITSQDPFFTGFIGWLLKKKFKLPFQIQIHTDPFSPYFKKESLPNYIRFLIAKFLIPRADCVRVVSERIKRSIVSSFKFQPSKIAILPIFVDAKKIQESPVKIDLHKKYPQFNFIIIMASRLTKEKNIGLAIEAITEVAKKYPKTGLIIAGSGPEDKNLKSKISNLKINDNVIAEGWVDDLASYYKTADLFLLASNYEGYGMAVVEAMVAGCSVIMTDVGLAGEILMDKKNGLVVPVGNKEKLIEAINKFIENPDLRAELTNNNHKIIDFLPAEENYLKAYSDSWRRCF